MFLLIGDSPFDPTCSPPQKTIQQKLAQKLRSGCFPTPEEMNVLQGLFAIPDQPVQETFPWMFVSRQDAQHPSTLWAMNFPKPEFRSSGGVTEISHVGEKCVVRRAMAVVPTNFGLNWNSSQTLVIYGVRLNQTVTVWGCTRHIGVRNDWKTVVSIGYL